MAKSLSLITDAFANSGVQLCGKRRYKTSPDLKSLAVTTFEIAVTDIDPPPGFEKFVPQPSEAKFRKAAPPVLTWREAPPLGR